MDTEFQFYMLKRMFSCVLLTLVFVHFLMVLRL